MDGTLGQSRRQRFHQHVPARSYCLKYGGKHEHLAPFVINQHRNGLLTPWGFNATHQVPQLTTEEYLSSRYVLNPLRLWDCDRPVNASTAYLFTTAERARNMRASPVYVLDHSQHNFKQRTDTGRSGRDRGLDRPRRAQNVRGCGAWAHGRRYLQFTTAMHHGAVLLEGFQWHGVKRGDAFAFYAAISGSRDLTRCAQVAAIWGTGGRARPCTPTASSSSAPRLAHGRSRFGQRPRWGHSPRQAMAAGSCSGSSRTEGLSRGKLPVRECLRFILGCRWNADGPFRGETARHGTCGSPPVESAVAAFGRSTLDGEAIVGEGSNNGRLEAARTLATKPPLI